MAQQLLDSADTGSESMGIINDNFTELYTDKIEADSTDTLTNKTIDGDLNTVQDLPYTAIKSTARSGLDTTLITGTEGSTDELAKWNSDGDLVSAGVSVSTSQPTSSSLDTTVPTSKAVHSAISSALTVKQFFCPVLKHSADAEPYDGSAVGDFAVSIASATEDVYFAFHVPADFVTLTSIHLVMIPDATESISVDVSTDIAAHGEASTIHSGSATDITLAVTSGNMTLMRIDNATGTPFSSMVANDMVGVMINSDTTDIRVIGLLVKYSS